jgi:hypothetical protein
MPGKRAAWLVLGPVVALTFGLGVAAAHKKAFPTKNVTITHSQERSNTVFSGKVITKRKACRRGRDIAVVNSRGRSVASTTSKRNGTWEATARRAAAGEYVAEAQVKRLKKNRRHNHRCRKRTSRTPTVVEGSGPGSDGPRGPRGPR